ncbi:hypothetical protein GCM10023082_03240 [Streptomyces tremellae]|uniref:Uncharacterized protein n=1 Tax=Streptomyces tremellae TaxID=1124239 RepID=A0ABP7DRN8_9ACTN
MSAITDSDSAISGGSVRDVLADTNNLSERWEGLPAPPDNGPEPTTDGWGCHRRRGLEPGKDYSPACGGRIPLSAATS